MNWKSILPLASTLLSLLAAGFANWVGKKQTEDTIREMVDERLAEMKGEAK